MGAERESLDREMKESGQKKCKIPKKKKMIGE
jgi:hypothetical protein